MQIGTADAARPSGEIGKDWGSPKGHECVECHWQEDPGLTWEWNNSQHGQSGVNSLDCHATQEGDVDVDLAPSGFRQQTDHLDRSGMARREELDDVLGILVGEGICRRLQVAERELFDPAGVLFDEVAADEVDVGDRPRHLRRSGEKTAAGIEVCDRFLDSEHFRIHYSTQPTHQPRGYPDLQAVDDLAANDTDIDGNVVKSTVELVDLPANGTATVLASGDIR